jgi:hypothetical protein
MNKNRKKGEGGRGRWDFFPLLYSLKKYILMNKNNHGWFVPFY